MPIYEYVCRGCGHQFEHLVRGDEKPACPACGKRRLDKQFSVVAAHTSGAQSSCAVGDAGACDASTCPGPGGCGMSGMM